MNILTTHNAEDIVYIIHGGQLTRAEVVRIEVNVMRPGGTNDPHRVLVKYFCKYLDINNMNWHTAQEMYYTKEEAGKVWLAAQGLTIGLEGGK